MPRTKESGTEQLRRMANEILSEPGEWHEHTAALARGFLEVREALEIIAYGGAEEPVTEEQLREVARDALVRPELPRDKLREAREEEQFLRGLLEEWRAPGEASDGLKRRTDRALKRTP